ncbi:docking protein 1 [Rhinophrynus dorsalis]
MAATDTPVKEGQIHIKQNKFGKKWKRCHALLYPDSPFGVARLEFYDWKDGTVAGDKSHPRRATDRKVVRLADCVHVAPAPSESGPKENMAAFTLETSDRTFLLATERALVTEWIQRLCEVAFPSQSTGSSCRTVQDTESADTNTNSLEMAVNSIYFSREDVCEFRVTVQRTEAAERCGLHGVYILQTEADSLILKNPNTREILYSWPYKLLRRYGRDKVMFSFESGRRCSSGSGNFTFETPQGHEIFQRVESSIRAQQGSENRLSSLNLDTDPITDLSSQGPESCIPDIQAKTEPARKDPEEKTLKSRTLPTLPASKPAPPQHFLDSNGLGANPGVSSTPPRSPASISVSQHPGGDAEHLLGVYSEPKDSVKGVKTYFDPLYSDPVDSVAVKGAKGQKPNTNVSVVSPIYSDLYEQVEYEVVGPGGVSSKVQSRPAFPPPLEEHIYDEPEGIAQPSEAPQVYSEVRMEGGAWKRQAKNETLGHEYSYNPNTDDYSVPSFQGQRNQPRNKAIGPKPIPAPKPQGKVITRPAGKEGEEDKMVGLGQPFLTNNNNNNSSNMQDLYSQVQKTGMVSKEAVKPHMTTAQYVPAGQLPIKSQSVPAGPLPAKPQSIPAGPLPAKLQSIPAGSLPAKPQSTPAGAPPAKPQSVPAGSLPAKQLQTQQLRPNLQSLPVLPLPNKPSKLVAQHSPVPFVHNPSPMLSEEELSVDENRITSIYEDMGVL